MNDIDRLAYIRHRSQVDGADGAYYLYGRWLLTQRDTMHAERDQYRRSYEMAQSLLETSEQREDALRVEVEQLRGLLREAQVKLQAVADMQRTRFAANLLKRIDAAQARVAELEKAP